jgi:hypothetical protein
MFKTNLVRVGGGSMLLAVALILGLFVVVGITGITETRPDPNNMEPWLQAASQARTPFLILGWFSVLDHLVEIPFFLGLYLALRKAGRLLWIGLTSAIAGALLVSLSFMLEVSMAWHLAPAFAEAGEAVRPALLALASTVDQFRLLLNVIGTVMAGGIGTGLFALALLRTSVFPHWIGWVGTASAVLSLIVFPLMLVWEGAQALFAVAMPVALVWVIGMAISMLRYEEPAETPHA